MYLSSHMLIKFRRIFSAVSTRLKAAWAKYLFLRQEAEKAGKLPPSTTPCHPAPGRRLLIIRNDNQPPAPNLFLGFDGIMSSTSSGHGTTQPTAYKRHSSLGALTRLETADTSNPRLTADGPTTPSKKRWTFMGKMLPSTFSAVNEGSPSPTRGTSPTKTLEEARRETALARSASRPSLPSKSSSSDSDSTTTPPSHRAYSFKFSLDYAQHFEKPNAKGGQGFNTNNERRICQPRLPASAHSHLGTRVPGISKEISPQDPAEGGKRGESIARAKYSGRALAEWTQIVSECNNFVERRKAEGVPGPKWVEVPTLNIEGFRRF
jgi:hypothetical protein